MKKVMKKIDKTKVKLNLQRLCEAFNLTPYALSLKTGITKATIYEWYNEGKLPSFSSIFIIKNFFSTSYEYLLEGNDSCAVIVRNGQTQSVVPYSPDLSLIMPTVPIANWHDLGKKVLTGRDIEKPMYRSSPIPITDDHFGIYVTGDEMLSYDGSFSFIKDTLLICNPHTMPLIGSIVIVLHPDTHQAILRKIIYADNDFYCATNDYRLLSFKLTKQAKIIATIECAIFEDMNQKLSLTDYKCVSELNNKLEKLLKS